MRHRKLGLMAFNSTDSQHSSVLNRAFHKSQSFPNALMFIHWNASNMGLIIISITFYLMIFKLCTAKLFLSCQQDIMRYIHAQGKTHFKQCMHLQTYYFKVTSNNHNVCPTISKTIVTLFATSYHNSLPIVGLA